jgi:hypothetical protein
MFERQTPTPELAMAILTPITKTTSTAPTVDLSEKVADLEARLALLESVLKVAPGGVVTLKTMSNLSIEAMGTMALKGSLITLN